MTRNRRSRLQKQPRVDVYRRVADHLVTAIARNEGLVPALDRVVLPVNTASGDVPYRGINTAILLNATPDARDPRWATYRGAERVDAHVRKGEKASAYGVSYKKVRTRSASEINDSDTASREYDDDLEQITTDGDRFIFLAKNFPLFHASQMDGLPAWVPAAPSVADPEAEVHGMLQSLSGENDRLATTVESMTETGDAWLRAAIRHMVWMSPRMDVSSKTGVLTADLATGLIEAELGLGHSPIAHELYPTNPAARQRVVAALIDSIEENPKAAVRAANAAQDIADTCLEAGPALGAVVATRRARQEEYRAMALMAQQTHQSQAASDDETVESLFSDAQPSRPRFH